MSALFINARDPDHGRRHLPRHAATRTSPTSATPTSCCRRCSARRWRASLFAVALLCSGQNATLTGTLAGQIVMEGFINIRLRPWLRRLITRLIAIIPAIIVDPDLRRARHRPAAHPEPGDPEPAAAVRRLSAGDVHQRSHQDGRRSSSPRWIRSLAWTVAVIIAALNVWLLYQTFVGYEIMPMYQRILVAIENSPPTGRSSTHVDELAQLTGAELLLVHVADGWAARHFDELKLRESEEMQRRPRLPRRSCAASSQGRGCTVAAAAGDGRSGDRADPAGRGAKAST